MLTHAPVLSHLLLLAILASATGCPANNQPAAKPTHNTPPTTQAPAAEPLPTDALSDMAFSVELLDPANGLPLHASIETLEPILLREIERITYEPTLRQVLNKPAVQNTQWFEQFEDDVDAAVNALNESVAAHHVPGTPLFRVYILRSLKTDMEEDAQVLLKELADAYMRQNEQRISVSTQEQLRAAQRAVERADEAVLSITAQLKRFVQSNPVSSSSSIERSRMNAIEAEALQRQLQRAEERRDRAIQRVSKLSQQSKGFLGYHVSVEYPPQRSR